MPLLLGLRTQGVEDAGEEAFGAEGEAPVVGLAVARPIPGDDAVLVQPVDHLLGRGPSLDDDEPRLAVQAAGVGGGAEAGGVGASEPHGGVGIESARTGRAADAWLDRRRKRQKGGAGAPPPRVIGQPFRSVWVIG